MDFLRGLLKRLRTASDLSAGGGAADADPAHLAFCAAVVAGLPFKRGDEPCMVVQVRFVLCAAARLALRERGAAGAGRAANSPLKTPSPVPLARPPACPARRRSTPLCAAAGRA